MSHSPSATTVDSSRVRRSRTRLFALWALQVILAAMFFLAGGSKLAGAPAMVATFDSIGVGQWFRYVTGVIEVVAAVALLVPRFAPLGALLLVPTMLGAMAAHLFIVGGSPAVPALLLLAALVVLWARRKQLSGVLSPGR